MNGLKNFLFFSIAISTFTSASHAQTNFEKLFEPTASKSNGYFVFINLNVSSIELSHFSAAAKASGDGLIMIPKMETLQKMANDNTQYINRKCADGPIPIPAGRTVPRSTRNDCTTIDDRLIKDADQTPVNLNLDLDAALSSIGSGNVHAFMISGHNSDGGFSGDYLSPHTFTHGDMIKLLAKHSEEQPQIFQTLNFLALWGCDTVSSGQTALYRSVLPAVTTIAGYGDTAPAGIREASGDYLTAAINLAPAWRQAHSKLELRKLISQSTAVAQIFAGIWVNTLDAGNFIFRRGESGVTIENDAQDCQAFQRRFPRERDEIRNYASGVTPIPADAMGTPLRMDYYDFTSFSQCYKHGAIDNLDAGTALAPTQVGLLRFFPNVKINFVNTFEKEMTVEQKNAILASDRMQLKSLVSELSYGDFSSRKLSMLVERYLVQLDEKCIDFLLWHAPRTTPPKASCMVGSTLEWKYQ